MTDSPDYDPLEELNEAAATMVDPRMITALGVEPLPVAGVLVYDSAADVDDVVSEIESLAEDWISVLRSGAV